MFGKVVNLGIQLLSAIESFFDICFSPLTELFTELGLTIKPNPFTDNLTLAWLVVGAFGIYIAYALLSWVIDVLP